MRVPTKEYFEENFKKPPVFDPTKIDRAEYLKFLREFSKYRDKVSCVKLAALGVLRDVKDDIMWDEEVFKKDSRKRNMKNYYKLRKKALLWVFDPHHEPSFFFWCNCAGIGPEKIRARFEKYKGVLCETEKK